jgi:preprotein translocase subunit YajC
MLDLLFMAQQGSGQEKGSSFLGFLPFIALIVVFYFFLIRPQMKRQKDTQSMLQSLRKGDRVTTTGGIIGTVVGIDVVIKVADGTKLEILKGFISQKM